jgi:hypothetical protein
VDPKIFFLGFGSKNLLAGFGFWDIWILVWHDNFLNFSMYSGSCYRKNIHIVIFKCTIQFFYVLCTLQYPPDFFAAEQYGLRNTVLPLVHRWQMSSKEAALRKIELQSNLRRYGRFHIEVGLSRGYFYTQWALGKSRENPWGSGIIALG